MKTSDYVVDFLKQKGITVVFELCGGMITHLLDSLYSRGGIKVVSMHHEQAAAFAADAFGRITGLPGVALATSGPGATNLITGIGSCYFDSTPAIFFTGQVNRNEQKGKRTIRQLGFQETDIVPIVKSISKMAVKVETPEEIPDLLENAFALSLSGRPGPVLLDIPMDVQRSEINFSKIKKWQGHSKISEEDENGKIAHLIASIKKAERPMVLAGGGIRASHSTELFREWIHKVKVPVVNSLMGVDVLPFSDPYRVGMIGTYGNRWANLALNNSDLLLVLGSRLDVRQTGSDTNFFSKNKNIFHVDCDYGEINNRLQGTYGIKAHLYNFLSALSETPDTIHSERWRGWIQEIDRLKRKWPDRNEVVYKKGINPNDFMHRLSQAAKNVAGYFVDVGQHQMWAAQSLELNSKQRFITSGGMGSMGFALPAAIGASFSLNSPVIAIAGDGGFQCNIQEMQTVVLNNLPIKIIIINNRCLGMVRQFQESYFDSRYQSTVWGYSAPDFEKISIAFGIPAKTIKDTSDTDKAIAWLLKNPQKPALLQVMIHSHVNAYPKIAFGRPLTDMEPFCR